MHDGEGWELLELGDKVGKKRIGVGVALQVEENLDGCLGIRRGWMVERSS